METKGAFMGGSMIMLFLCVTEHTNAPYRHSVACVIMWLITQLVAWDVEWADRWAGQGCDCWPLAGSLCTHVHVFVVEQKKNKGVVACPCECPIVVGTSLQTKGGSVDCPAVFGPLWELMVQSAGSPCKSGNPRDKPTITLCLL